MFRSRYDHALLCDVCKEEHTWRPKVRWDVGEDRKVKDEQCGFVEVGYNGRKLHLHPPCKMRLDKMLSLTTGTSWARYESSGPKRTADTERVNRRA